MDTGFIEKRPIAVGMLPDGRMVTISEIETQRPMRGHDDTTHVAVDVGAGAGAPAVGYGFTDFGEAMRFVTSWGEDDYTGYDANGQPTVTRRHGLGCPEALLSRRGDPKGKGKNADKGEPSRVSSPNVSGARIGTPADVPGSTPKTEVASGSEPGFVQPVTTGPATLGTEPVDTNLPGLNDE